MFIVAWNKRNNTKAAPETLITTFLPIEELDNQVIEIKVFKVSLNGGFSCPNLDGKVGFGGCIYCSKTGSGEFAGDKNESIDMQFDKIKEMMLKKWQNAKYIGYFQAHTNTYAPVKKLKELGINMLYTGPKVEINENFVFKNIVNSIY